MGIWDFNTQSRLCFPLSCRFDVETTHFPPALQQFPRQHTNTQEPFTPSADTINACLSVLFSRSRQLVGVKSSRFLATPYFIWQLRIQIDFLQNRGSRVRVLPPLPRKKPNAIALGFFQRNPPYRVGEIASNGCEIVLRTVKFALRRVGGFHFTTNEVSDFT